MMADTDDALDQFAYCSKAVAKLLRTFGVPGQLDDNLRSIALWGPDPTLWVEGFADRIAADADAPISVHPWQSGSALGAIEWSGRCANFTAAWLLAQLWQALFPDQPQFTDLKTDIPAYIKRHRKHLAARYDQLVKVMNRAEWIRLAEQMEIERAKLITQTQLRWSIARSPSDWLKLFDRLNVDCRSLKTFQRRRDEGTLRQHPESTTKSVRLAIDDLPPSYSDEMTV